MTSVEFDIAKKFLDNIKKARDGLLQIRAFQQGWVSDNDGRKGLLTDVLPSFPACANRAA
ncbi:hypothetical protein [Methylosinus sp. KRF6]|uniref:hypothetical protein n=1 Tax=Methylosinus sp. KRF6 TaxID=2846853 RepID=UPI001C0C1F87|nr:hypothetical protein [Methylosinus sp. KRF6]MBU3889667.1 hypothetical protein [Methylosinus sp. KRF6]